MKKKEYLKNIDPARSEGRSKALISRKYVIALNAATLILIWSLLADFRFIPAGLSWKILFDIFWGQQIGLEGQSSYTDLDSRAGSKVFTSLQELSKKYTHTPEPGTVVVLIVAESLGVPNSRRLHQLLTKEYLGSLKSAISSRPGNSATLSAMQLGPSWGATLPAELAYLCDLNSAGKDKFVKSLNRIPKHLTQRLEGCIPNTLRKKGWETIYYHAAGLQFYNRNKIMPLIGFADTYSAVDEAKEPWPSIISRCIRANFCAFPDSMVFRKALWDISRKNDRNVFATIMTIDPHGPYRSPSLLKRTSEEEVFANRASQSIKDISRFTADLLGQEEERNISIIIASDHPPPISTTEANPSYSWQKSNYIFSIKKIQKNKRLATRDQPGVR